MRTIGIALLLIGGVAAFAQNLDKSWVVVGIVGKWRTVADKPEALYFGMALKPSAAFVREPRQARSGSITLAWDKDARITHACENAGDCDRIFEVPQAPQPGAPAAEAQSRSFREILLALTHEPRRYLTAVSRDTGSLQDGVVRSGDKGADLTPVLSELGKGEYWFKIERLGHEQTAPAGAPVKFIWDPDRGDSAVWPGMSPGLYRIQITNEQGEALGSDAWVLASKASGYDQARAAFREIVNQTAGWRDDVPPAGIRAVQRARLEALAR